MALLHIDDRLAGLAEAATHSARRPGSFRRPHDRRVAVAAGSDLAVSAERALELSGLLLEALANGDSEVLGAICCASVHARTPSSETDDLDGLVAASCVEASAFTAIEVAIQSLVAADGSIAAEWRLYATHTGPLTVSWATIEATGQGVTLDGVLVGQVVVDEAAGGDERTVFDDVHLYYDTTSLLVQLGLS